MTSLVLKSGLATKALIYAEQMLGQHSIKTGRYWYKGQQICDYVIVKSETLTQIQTSGGVRFHLLVHSSAKVEPSGRVTLLGWLKESPNALRIIMSILEQQGKIVERRRQDKERLLASCRSSGQTAPELNEAVGAHFSIKMPDAPLDAADRIDQARSDENFELALRLNWYHQAFVSYCKKLGVKCYYRSAFEARERSLPQHPLASASAAAYGQAMLN